MTYLPYVRCCVSLKWALTAKYSEFTQWEVLLLGSASTLVYVWIWHWNIHSSTQACVHTRCRHVNMDTCRGSHLKKNVEALPRPLQEFHFSNLSFFFFYSMHAPWKIMMYIIFHGSLIQADVVSSPLQRTLMSFFLLASWQNVDSLSVLGVLHNISKWGSGSFQPSFQRTSAEWGIC